jgi:preprotein translocase subunit SecD
MKSFRSLILIVIVVAISIYLILPNPYVPGISHAIKTYLGLDLIGGIQVLLEADLPSTTTPTAEQMNTARQIVENRVNGLGVSEAVVQLAGDRRIVVELPGVEDPEQAVSTIKGTALLEFVDMGSNPLPVGTTIKTDYAQSSDTSSNTGQANTPTADQTTTPTPEQTGTPAASGAGTTTTPDQVYHTIMTGADLTSARVVTDRLNRPSIAFELTPNGSQIFNQYTSANVGKYLAIVLDNQVISAPVISVPITNGQGQIEGNFTLEEANSLTVQLRYGSLPVPLKVVETRTVGPTLGQDSLQKSLIAGMVGLMIVMLFMAIYYRVPGLVADLAILVYGLLTFALFRTIPITLTLAGIAGLMLSTGSALDANILIFERLKEELRAKRPLHQAVDLGFRRAWPSIRDSNIATLITCTILFWFGSSFGATIVKGFAITLFLGVIVSLFTAIFVTRVVLALIFNSVEPKNYVRWFGL